MQIKNSIRLKQTLNIDMPYHSTDFSKFYAALNADWFNPQVLAKFRRAMRTVDYSVIESRRDGLTAFNQMINSALHGSDIFDLGARFPQYSPFYTDYDALLSRIFSMYQSTLSYRPGNVAKDTDSAIQSGSGQGRNQQTTSSAATSTLESQGNQDNTKRFEEANNLLQTYMNNPDNVWTQVKFEHTVNVAWKAKKTTGGQPGKIKKPVKPHKVTAHRSGLMYDDETGQWADPDAPNTTTDETNEDQNNEGNDEEEG